MTKTQEISILKLALEKMANVTDCSSCLYDCSKPKDSNWIDICVNQHIKSATKEVK